jgi:methionyl-tRNA formyltransferase
LTLRIAFIGCVESSEVALRALLELPLDAARVVGVVTRQASKFNADFVDLVPLAQRHDLPTLFVETTPDETDQAAWLEQLRPDLIFCVGWSRLLGHRVLSLPPLGVVGFHPAALPANRGRHPLIWALALGLEETASSFFLMDAGADSGPILSQEPIAISQDDDAATLYAKVLAVIPGQLRHIVHGLHEGTLVPQPQDASRATYWRKRSAADGQVDWRMSARSICNLVRALARPYPGAHFMHQGAEVKVWKCAPAPAAAPNLEPGKVLAVEGRCITVKCGDTAVRLIDHALDVLPEPGSYL